MVHIQFSSDSVVKRLPLLCPSSPTEHMTAVVQVGVSERLQAVYVWHITRGRYASPGRQLRRPPSHETSMSVGVLQSADRPFRRRQYFHDPAIITFVEKYYFDTSARLIHHRRFPSYRQRFYRHRYAVVYESWLYWQNVDNLTFAIGHMGSTGQKIFVCGREALTSWLRYSISTTVIYGWANRFSIYCSKKLIRRWDTRAWHRSILLPLLRLTLQRRDDLR